MDQQEKYELAAKRAEAKIGFYIHAGVYLAVNALLVGINLATNSNVIWFIWPLIGWGIGLLGHGLLVFNAPDTSRFKQKLIDKELDKLQ